MTKLSDDKLALLLKRGRERLTMTDEVWEWRVIPGYEDDYEISNWGVVRRSRRSKARSSSPGNQKGHLKAQRLRNGYFWISLCQGSVAKAMTVHKLVTLAFLGPRPKGLQVNHKNGVRHDNRISNLEYVTPRQNTLHSKEVLKKAIGSKHHGAKLTEADIPEIRRRWDEGESRVAIARDFGVTPQSIRGIGIRKTWRHV